MTNKTLKGDKMALLFYGAISLLLLFIYFALRNIFIFFIDDKFNVLHYGIFFFSYEYGGQAAYLLLSSLTVLCLYGGVHRLIKRGAIDVRTSGRHWPLLSVIIISLLSAFFDAAYLLTSFFMGELGIYNLLQTLITLGLALLFLAFAYFEMRLKKLTRTYCTAVLTPFISLTTIAIALALHQAPPHEQKIIHQDVSRVEKLDKLSFSIDEYFHRYHKLPTNLAVLTKELALDDEATLDPITRTPFSYQTTGGETFQLCAVFNKDAKSARRIRPSFATRDLYKAGSSCLKYVVSRAKNECEKKCLENCRQHEASRAD